MSYMTKSIKEMSTEEIIDYMNDSTTKSLLIRVIGLLEEQK